MSQERVTLGVVGVDTASLVICDPAHITDVDPYYIESEELGERCQDARDKWLKDMLQKPGTGGPMAVAIPFKKGHEGAAVMFSSGVGDGSYEVVATYADVPGFGRRICKVEVLLVPDVLEDASANLLAACSAVLRFAKEHPYTGLADSKDYGPDLIKLLRDAIPKKEGPHVEV